MEISVIITVIFFVAFILFGLPIAFCLGAAGAIGLLASQDGTTLIGIFKTTPFRCAANFNLATVPLFVLMAELLNETGLAKRAFVTIHKWVGHWPGGLAVAAMIGGAVFGACSGSSSASCATFGSIAVPEMRKYDYSPELASGTVALAGTLAALIPPSILLVLYGLETENSIGRLLMAGVVPGLLMTLLYAISIIIIVMIRPEEAPSIQPTPWRERWRLLQPLWPLTVLGVVVLGAIYTGFATPTEAAAIGVIGAFAVGLVVRTLSVEKVMKALRNTLKTVGMIFAIIIGATIFSYFFTLAGTTQNVINAIGGLPVPRGVILLVVVLLYLLLGMFLDAIGCMLITLPLIYPLIVKLGYDPIWFGVILVMLLEIGLVTPPVGVNCFIASGTSGVPLNTVFKGALRLLVGSFVGLTLVILFPQLGLWLPSTMK
ncbi:MAG: TRAP transporter large permease subunit [Desulfobacteraceae bacterium]|nr:MAG: TRAP transporter large permease subunit [Desulfobacteraceae bacterium]